MVHNVVLPLATSISAKCYEAGKTFSMSFVTNGYLLTNDVLEKLMAVRQNRVVAFQITLDGSEAFHNKVRYTEKGEGSYRRIVSNMKNALRQGCFVTLRFNYTANSLLSFIDILPDIEDLSVVERSRLRIDMHRVWQDKRKIALDLEKQENHVREVFATAGFTLTRKKSIEKYRCYADKENELTINYNGELFRCTARDFVSENREGVLNEDGSLAWNEKAHLRTQIKFGNAYCQACQIYPLCHGGCSQNKLEAHNKSGCYFHYNEQEKVKILEGRIESLLEINMSNQKQKIHEES